MLCQEGRGNDIYWHVTNIESLEKRRHGYIRHVVVKVSGTNIEHLSLHRANLLFYKGCYG